MLGLLIFAFLLPEDSMLPQENSELRPPNILIILADDQGWGDLSYSGNPMVQTPNIDHLAKNGAVFEHFYVDPVCSPTRAALLTGRYAVRGGIYDTSAGGERLDLDEHTFAEAFQKAGYHTAAFGKWHNGAQGPYHPRARGFDEFYGYCSGHWGSYFDASLEHNGKTVQSKGYLTDVLTEKAMQFMVQSRKKPFLLYLPLNTPHSPMQVPERWWQKFAGKELPAHHFSSKEKADHTRAAYAMAENIDWNVGRITQKLRELNLLDNTLVLYFSDNGPNGWRWNGGMAGIKGHTDEGGVRSPLIVYGPTQIGSGKKIPQIAYVADLFPTLLELAGINSKPAKTLDGKSLVPLLKEENPNWPERFIVNHWNNRTSVRSQQYRLNPEGQLFDMKQDPGQNQDIATAQPQVLARLLAAKKEWVNRVLSELPAQDTRSCSIGLPAVPYDHLPAGDTQAHGSIKRSNRWPNHSFYTNWNSTSDSLTWDVEVLADGIFETSLFYTCPQADLGAVLELGMAGQSSLQFSIQQAHNPALQGQENDRILREESYVKNFKSLRIGRLYLKKGMGKLVLKALHIPGKQVMDFAELQLKRVK